MVRVILIMYLDNCSHNWRVLLKRVHFYAFNEKTKETKHV